MAVSSAGAEDVAAGIVERPVYAFDVPQAFLDSAPPAAGPGVHDIRDYGAVADAGVDNRAAIQSAIDAAHAAGGGIVYVPPGTWGIGGHPASAGSLQLDDNVFLKGAGMGQSVLRLVDGTGGVVTGMVRSAPGVVAENWGVADLTLDGNKANTTAQVDGFYTGPKPGVTDADADVYVLRVEVHDVSRYGIDPHEQTVRLSVRDSVSHDNGFDGFTVDFVSQSEFVGNLAYDNGRHGFNFVTSSHDILAADNVAYGNGGNGFVIQRGSEDITPSYDIALIGGQSYGNGGDGVLVHLALNVTVSGMQVSDNGGNGIRLLGTSHTTVADNVVSGNSQAQADLYSEILLDGYSDSVSGTFFQAAHNLVSGNTLTGADGLPSRYGIEERANGTVDNEFADNTSTGSVRGASALQGANGVGIKTGTQAVDDMLGDIGRDHMFGLEGNDVIRANAGNDVVDGGAGDDVLAGNVGSDVLKGGDGSDTIAGGYGRDIIAGGAGDDALSGNSDDDRLFAGDGRDRVYGELGNDTLNGGLGDDDVRGGSGHDWIQADAGNDTILGGAGIDVLDFSRVETQITVDLYHQRATGAGLDEVHGIEMVIGTGLDDSIKGRWIAETLAGGEGNDVLAGRGGSDVLTGGAGSDRFVWGTHSDVVLDGASRGVDHVTDFAAGDVLDIRGLLAGATFATIDEAVRFTGLEGGTLLSVNIAGSFQEVAVLDGALLTDVAGAVEAGLILI